MKANCLYAYLYAILPMQEMCIIILGDLLATDKYKNYRHEASGYILWSILYVFLMLIYKISINFVVKKKQKIIPFWKLIRICFFAFSSNTIEAAHIPWLMAPFLHLWNQQW